MTIRPDEAWGRSVPRPVHLAMVDDDAALATMLAGARAGGDGPPVGVRRGDMARTLGIDPSAPSRDQVNELPIDLVEVRLDDGAEVMIACAHVIARSPARRGSWWRGPVVMVMNAEFLGDWDVAPRGHPNDGRVEVFEADATMSIRQRVAARRRVRTASHVPHPKITKRSVRSATWTFPRVMTILVDGRRVGTATSVGITVLPDAAVVYA